MAPYLEKEFIADTAFVCRARTLKKIFQKTAEMVVKEIANPKTVKPKTEKKIFLKEKEADKLLFRFLNEIVYIKDCFGMAFSNVIIEISKKKGFIELNAVLKGEKINKGMELKSDIKAVAFNNDILTKKGNCFTAKIVLDI